MNTYRIIDANINRVSEGLRVIEDIERFIFEKEKIAKEIREIRHLVRKCFKSPQLLQNRNSNTDIGLKISQNTTLDKKEDIDSLLISNFKRVEEGLRSIEECLKILEYYQESKIYEKLRFSVYSLEKKVFIKALPRTDIYGITGERFSKGRTNIEVVKDMINAGIKIIQYREKDKSKREKYEDCVAIRELTKKEEITFIVNDDIDIAILVGADGIHIGQDDIPIEEVKQIAPNMIIGLSTHNSEQAIHAVKAGANYIGVGPIFKTTTKEDTEHSQGLNYLKWVSENIGIPYVAIGGIKEENIASVKEHGGQYYAMISELTSADSMSEKVKSIREILKEEEE
ncbi:thiamine phosphate synthase [Anaerosalibacter sp. Marseille-P3206]|uniref:thiamine phosphate synthase n=1 Tax=Anaerosalibacter sp. Marseille-P3206 TaxID=1871005 RepID=UPI000984CA0F|nr:thiamine phosphate synthase [Anaerosalibacter sp. Marseille-P3206]